MVVGLRRGGVEHAQCVVHVQQQAQTFVLVQGRVGGGYCEPIIEQPLVDALMPKAWGKGQSVKTSDGSVNQWLTIAIVVQGASQS